MTRDQPSFRPLTEQELGIFKKLFEINFAGKTELSEQLCGLLAKEIDDNGSLKLKVQKLVFAPIKQSVAVEARCPDSDTRCEKDAHINILLHVVDGIMSMLEIYKDDSTPVLRKPEPFALHVFSQLAIKLSS
jgi:hypothetical protein